MLKQLEQTLSHAGIGRRVLLAVSGGSDSMAMAELCYQLRRVRKLELAIAHVNHRLRRESDGDCAFVSSYAASRNIPFYLYEATPPTKGNIEQWGRNVRYRFFAAVKDSIKADVIFTAHTADDMVETFLMRFLSNKELRGILEIDSERGLERPLLAFSKDELVTFLRANRLSYREDKTNADIKYLRNWVRHILIAPIKERFGANIVKVMAKAAVESRQVYMALDAAIKMILAEIPNIAAEINSLSPVLKPRIEAELVRQIKGYRPGVRHAARLLRGP